MPHFKCFGNPLPFPLPIDADWVRIQCGVVGDPNYIFGLEGLKEFYAAGTGLYTRKNGIPENSLDHWIVWYNKEKEERIKVNTLIHDIKTIVKKTKINL